MWICIIYSQIALLLALYNLHRHFPRSGEKGFFHWKSDIYDYIKTHREMLYSPKWVVTHADAIDRLDFSWWIISSQEVVNGL